MIIEVEVGAMHSEGGDSLVEVRGSQIEVEVPVGRMVEPMAPEVSITTRTASGRPPADSRVQDKMLRIRHEASPLHIKAQSVHTLQPSISRLLPCLDHKHHPPSPVSVAIFSVL